MIDIVGAPNGMDLHLADTVVERAKNILSTQLGSLEYAPDFGIDLEYFLSEDFVFQDAAFRSYQVQRLSELGISVLTVMSELSGFMSTATYDVASQAAKEGLIEG